MAVLGNTFNAQDHDTTQNEYSELPNGIYKLEIEASDVVPTKAGDGTILKTTMVVVEPEDYKGRKLFGNYNLENKNPDAQRIGLNQFASLCRAIEADSVTDSEDLHFHTFTVKIGLGKPSKDGQYPARAEIKRYFFPDEGNVPEPEIDENQPAAAAKPANDNRKQASNDNRAAPKTAAAGGGNRPWSKK